MTTNYANTFIAVSPDSLATVGAHPKPGTVAAEQLALILGRPYVLTSDDVLFEVYAKRNGIVRDDWAPERAVFFAKPKACLRASALVKSYGWGFHHDLHAKVAAFAVASPDYISLSEMPEIEQLKGMRSRRA